MTEAPLPDTLPQIQRRGMRDAILAQCFGCLSTMALRQGLVLVYLTALGMENLRIVAYLAIPPLADAILRVPCSIASDRYGKKRLGGVGMFLVAIGFMPIPLAGSLSGVAQEVAVVSGLLLYSFGWTLGSSSWFALLSPLVPEDERGRFFGRLRFSWQLCAILFISGCTLFLSHDSPIALHQLILFAAALATAVRLVFYIRLPELEPPRPSPAGVGALLLQALRAPGLASLCAYLFLLALFTGGVLPLFGLVEKRFLGLGDDLVVLLGNVSMVGAVIGFLIGGRAVDRYGTKPVFILCHLGFGIALASFLARGAVPGLLTAWLGGTHFLYGLLTACSSIAVTTEILALIPAENKSLSTSLCQVFIMGGMALSGLIPSWVLNAGMLKERWVLLGQDLCEVDTIILGYAGMVVMLVITLGLVPSVLRKSQWLPQ